MRILAAVLAVLGAALAPFAQAQAPSEPALKAAFLFKFAGYVEWPPSSFARADTPFVIAIAGAPDVAAELERTVQGRTIQQRPIVVRRIQGADSVRSAHMVFVGRAEPGGRALLRAAEAAGALAVSEGDAGLENGAAINFVSIDDRIGFEVSLEAAERAGLRISARMLSVARRVVPRPSSSGLGETELVLFEVPRAGEARRTLA